MAKAGRRKPRKQISSNIGARRVPKAVTSQTSEGVRKKSSMGMDLGTGMSEEMAWTVKPTARPRGMSLRTLRRAAAKFQWMPSVKGRDQRGGKKNQGGVRGMMWGAAIPKTR